MNHWRESMYRMRQQMEGWLYGRNGMDDFAKICYGIGLFLLFMNFFIHSRWVSLVSMGFLCYALFRIFSKNIGKRQKENMMFLQLIRGPEKYVHLYRLRIQNRKESRYYLCKGCEQIIRVPRGKGRIEITCPRCKKKFVKRT